MTVQFQPVQIMHLMVTPLRVVGKKRRVATIKIKKDDLIPLAERRTLLATGLSLDQRIKLKAIKCSWTKRKDQLIAHASPFICPEYLNILQQPRPVEYDCDPRKSVNLFKELFDRSSLFRVQAEEIAKMQKGRLINRDSLIRGFILPVLCSL